MDSFIKLSDKTPVFETGRHRAVYLHPDNPDLVVKVVRNVWWDLHEKRTPWRKRFKPLGANAINMHEFCEMMRLVPQSMETMPHLYTAVGMVRTDLGWGLVSKLERDKDNNPAKTINQLGADLINHIDAFKEFGKWLEQSPVVLTSLNFNNLVLAWRNGKEELVIIDGFGERVAIPLRTYFPKYNQPKNMRSLDKILNHFNLREAYEKK